MANPLERPHADRVAVIAVHGIADQKRGDTGEAVALQLAAASGGRSVAQELPLTVPPLDPAVPYRRWRPEGWGGRGRKSLRQSWRSDFLDDAIGGMPTGAAQANSATPHAAARGPTPACASPTTCSPRRRVRAGTMPPSPPRCRCMRWTRPHCAPTCSRCTGPTCRACPAA